jgi:DNA-directed RNA polymerase subunit RPC12/RpoP
MFEGGITSALKFEPANILDFVNSRAWYQCKDCGKLFEDYIPKVNGKNERPPECPYCYLKKG